MPMESNEVQRVPMEPRGPMKRIPHARFMGGGRGPMKQFPHARGEHAGFASWGEAAAP